MSAQSDSMRIDPSDFFDFVDRLSGRADMLIGEALLMGALEAMTVAKENAPIDTGLLRSSIHWESRGGKSPGKKLSVTPQAGEIFVGSALNYAGEMEFKHRNSSGYLRKGFEHGMEIVNRELIKMNLDD